MRQWSKGADLEMEEAVEKAAFGHTQITTRQ